MIFEATPVSPDAAQTSIYNIHHFWGPEHVPGMSRLTTAIHKQKARAFIQLSPGLGVQAAMRGSGVIPKAPSPVNIHLEAQNVPESLMSLYMKNPLMIPELEGEIPEELTEEEIEERIAAFKRACKLAILAGFDGVEIHSPHGYLVHDFLSPRYNKRTDEYGGSLENRMRFLLRLIRSAKEVLYDNLTLGARLSLDEHTEDGIRFDEVKQVAQAGAAEGLDYVHVSDGCYEQSKHFLPAEDGTMLERAAVLKESLRVPVITPCLHAPDLAAEAVAEGKTDMVSSSRAFIADPDWATKVKTGNGDAIRKCIRCNRCIFELFACRPIRCSANKKVGSERFELTKILGIGAKKGT